MARRCCRRSRCFDGEGAVVGGHDPAGRQCRGVLLDAAEKEVGRAPVDDDLSRGVLQREAGKDEAAAGSRLEESADARAVDDAGGGAGAAHLDVVGDVQVPERRAEGHLVGPLRHARHPARQARWPARWPHAGCSCRGRWPPSPSNGSTSEPSPWLSTRKMAAWRVDGPRASSTASRRCGCRSAWAADRPQARRLSTHGG
jgi:hypothetical protein